uniref:Zinc finger BED-type containing 5 n=1 Tax=Crocodylus porosus TaxID=8502 RepID=A0A7M4F4W3_CROPO
MSKKKKYDEDYVLYGFTCVNERDGTQKPQCFLRGKILPNGSMKTGKRKECGGGGVCAKKAQFEKAGTLPKLGFAISQKPFLEGSYKFAYWIAKQKKPHTIGETLVKPCALEMVELVCGLEQRKKLEVVSLSNDVIRSRIVDISFNILKQVIEELAASPFPFSMQLDETTDISQCSQLLVFVCYVHADTIKEEFFCCESLLETTKAINVLEMVKSFFAKQNFDWKEKLHTLCTDEAPAMLSNTSGFATLVKKEAPHVIITHCFLYGHALATKIPTNLKEVLSTAIKVINFIRSRSLNHRIFKRFCQEMGAEYEVLLYHTEICWLSREQVLKCLFELRAEVSLFLKEKENPLLEHFEREDFIHGLAYLADIFNYMNEINLSIQGPKVTIMDATEKLQAFLAKLLIWKKRVEANILANFQILEEVLYQNGAEIQNSLSISLKREICEHLETLQNSFKSYFYLDGIKVEPWIRNLFLPDINCIEDVNLAKDELIDLRTKNLQLEFNSESLGEFWCSLREAYPRLVKTTPQFNVLIQAKQQQPSHWYVFKK